MFQCSPLVVLCTEGLDSGFVPLLRHTALHWWTDTRELAASSYSDLRESDTNAIPASAL